MENVEQKVKKLIMDPPEFMIEMDVHEYITKGLIMRVSADITNHVNTAINLGRYGTFQVIRKWLGSIADELDQNPIHNQFDVAPETVIEIRAKINLMQRILNEFKELENGTKEDEPDHHG